MKKILLSLTLPLLCLSAVQVHAADTADTTTKSRADVKAETRASAKSGTVAQPSITSAADAADNKAPTTGRTRADVKNEAKAASQNGAMTNSTPADAALKADSVTTPGKPSGMKKRKSKMAAPATDSSAGMNPGASAAPAAGPASAETKKPTN